jgi:hypothetical protein
MGEDGPLYPEHVCSDGYTDWGAREDCVNCGSRWTPDQLLGAARFLDGDIVRN